jgi:mannosyltransferase OCH1-like enzyme
MNIPKIIHHIAPVDKSRWHPIWSKCYTTWKKHFPNFEHKLWNDAENIDNFMREQYPQYLQLYSDFPAHIMRIDFVRFCLLHRFGGIYSDMDMFCYKNFYKELDTPLMIVEAPYGDEFLESSLMISEPNHQFWIDCMELSKEVFYTTVKKYGITIPFNNNRADQYLLQSACGPNLICRVWRRWHQNSSDKIKRLSGILYNNHGMSYHPEYRTKHLMTGMWGKEAVDYIATTTDQTKSLAHNLDLLYVSEMKKYAQLHNVNNVDDYDFYYDYTNGGMKTYFNVDLDRNDIDTHKAKNFNYE